MFDRRSVLGGRLVKSGLLGSVLLMVSSGCSSRARPEVVRDGEGYKVSVSADGRQVKNFSEQLVHRVVLTRRQYNTLTRSWPRGLPFSARSEYDNSGNPSGLRITAVRRKSNSPELGLRARDLVTAVGTTHTRSTSDIRKLFVELGQTKSASLTLVRKGKPHKILYSLQ